jgi:branched-chain amino acid transport system ATP-binding protein
MMLQVANLDLFYGDAQALDDVALDIAEGEIVAIVGANGAGKTSLIRTIAGMQRPSRGAIRFEGAEIAGEPSHRICDLGIGQVAEGRQIFPNMSVLENLEMGAVIMFDEPSLGLAPLVVRDVFAVIRRLNQEEGLTIVLVEQNVALSLGLADRGYVLENGRIVMTGAGAALLADDRVRQAYVGL